MNLVPGNWFELKNINKLKTKKYTLEELKSEILTQIYDRSEKLAVINRSLLVKYPKSTIDDITFYLDDTKFNEMIKKLEAETRHPIITFHGTTKLDNVQSINKNGYIIPGKHKQNTNITVKIKHGSAYGSGIYSSPFFDKCLTYTTPDESKYVYVLFNLTFLGRMTMISPDLRIHPKINSSGGVYEDGTNTRILFGLEQIISADPDRIIPIGVIKIKI